MDGGGEGRRAACGGEDGDAEPSRTAAAGEWGPGAGGGRAAAGGAFATPAERQAALSPQPPPPPPPAHQPPALCGAALILRVARRGRGRGTHGRRPRGRPHSRSAWPRRPHSSLRRRRGGAVPVREAEAVAAVEDGAAERRRRRRLVGVHPRHPGPAQHRLQVSPEHLHLRARPRPSRRGAELWRRAGAVGAGSDPLLRALTWTATGTRGRFTA